MNRFVEEVVHGGNLTNNTGNTASKTGNRYVDAVISGQSVNNERRIDRSAARAAFLRKRNTEQQMQKKGKQTTRKRIDTGADESQIGEGWQGRTNLDKLWGEKLNTTAYKNSADAALAKLDDTTPSTTNMNDPTRYAQMQEARRRANDQQSREAGSQEAYDAAKWEETQRIGIQGTKDNQLLQNLQQLNELYTTANLGHESVAQTAKEQYDTLYSQLKSQYGDQVDEWAEYVKRLANAESMGEMTQRIANVADESPVVASLATPLVNVASGAGIVDVAAQKLGKTLSGSNTPIDYNRAAQLPSNWVNTTRETVSQKIAENTDGWIGSDTPVGNLYSGLYNIGMSMADSVVGQKLGGATVFMGGAAATNAMNEARERGASTDQALAMGLLAGVAETVMEKIPMEKLLSQTSPTSVRSAIKNILSQGASEATEEGLTTLANTVSDAIIRGDKSELNTAIRRYRADGDSDEDAQKKAFTDWLIGLAGDAIGGFVSGGLFSAAYNIPGGIDYKRSNTGANAEGASNTQTNANSTDTNVSPFDSNAGVDTDTAVADNAKATDPMEFAVRETLKPTKERQAMDQALQRTAEWMNGKEETITSETIAAPPETGTGRSDAMVGTADTVSQTHEDVKRKFEKFLMEHKGKPSFDQYSEFGHSLTPEEIDVFNSVLDEPSSAMDMLFEDMDADPAFAGTKGWRVGQEQDINSENDMGAKKSDFEHEIKQSKGNTTPDFEETHNVPEAARTNTDYIAVTEAETNYNAKLRLEQDFDGEVEELRRKAAWSAEEMSMGRMILEDLWAEADGTDDWTAYQDWAKVFEAHKEEGGRALQNLAQINRRSGLGIVQEAANILETNTSRKGTDTNAVMNKVSEAAHRFDAARTSNDVDGLVQLIKDTAGERNTGFRKRKDGTQKQSKYLNWALDRIAGYAKSGELTGDVDTANMDAIGAPLVQNYTISPGDKVRVSDRGNYGTVVSVNENGTYTIHFKAKSGAEATKTFTGEMVTKLGQKKPAYSAPGASSDTAGANLQINASNIQNPDVAFRFLQDFASTGILNIAADTQKVSKATQLMALRRSGMLSKFSTFMRNFESNCGFNIMDTIARDISVPLDMLISNFTKTRSTSMDYGYLSKAARQGSLDNIAIASLETSLDVNGRNNGGKYTAGGQRTFKMSGNVVERFFSRLEALQGYEMYVPDEMSKGRTQAEVQRGTDKLYEQGKIKAGDDSLRDAGTQTAQYRTFQDESALSNATLKTRDALNEFHAGDVGAGDVLMPFAQVPANLVDRSIDYSPAGLAKTTGKLVEALSKAKKGEFTAADQARVVQSLGRNITGTAMIAIATALAANGLIRVENPGDEDENKDKTAFERMQGQTGTQWNLSATLRKMSGGDPTWQDDDVLMSIAFLEPMNAQLTIGALLAEAMEQEGQLTAETAFKKSFTGALAAIKDLPMFDTIGDAIDAYKYSPEEQVGDKLWDAGETLLANEVVSIIPNWMKGIAQGLDPYQRDLYSKDDTWGQVGDQFRSVFDRKSLPVKQDNFGRDMTNEGGVLNFLNTNILPGYITKYHTDPLTDEITRIAEETGSNSVYPSRKAPDELSIDGEKVPLSYEEKQQYQKTYGNTDEAIRTGLMESEAYGKLTTEEKGKAHQYSEDYAKQVASNKVNEDYDMEDWVAELQGKSEAEIVEAVLYKTFSSLVDGKEYANKYDGMADLVDQGKLSDAMAITMMPEKMKAAYQNVAKAGGVSVDEWLDMYAYAYPNGKTETGGTDNEKIRNAALEYIDKQSWGDSKKTAAASAIFQFLTDTVPLQQDIPYDWALNQGDSGLDVVVNNMSAAQKENYKKYIQGHFDNDKMKLYLDAYKFKGTAKNIYEEDGETVKKSAQDQVIEYIDSLEGLTNREKIRIFLGLDYSEKKIPYWWYD